MSNNFVEKNKKKTFILKNILLNISKKNRPKIIIILY